MAAGTHADPHIAALSIGLALVAGITAQIIARRLSIPGIVLLLGTGLLLGPEVVNLIQPASLGEGLHTLIGFAVAVILFEGSLSLDLRRLRREARVIQLLVTVGALITAAGAAVAARLLLQWEWRPSILFGSLVMVTGPTVIQPLLERIRVSHKAHSVLAAEGIFVDAVGAICAVVALEVALTPELDVLGVGLSGLGSRFGAGILVGGIAGGIITLALRKPGRIPEGLGNIFTLAVTLGAFQVSNAVAEESGVVAAIVGGLVVGNSRVPVKKELLSFKEQLTTLLISLLFVLLAADVELREVTALGVAGLLTVAVLMFLVRPLAVFISTHGSDLSRGEKLFISWLGPRGIVAAAVASLFAERLAREGVQEGTALRALVFMVIAVTVTVQGLSGGWVARVLGVQRSLQGGYVLLGAGGLARMLGRALRDAGEQVLFIENAPERTRHAQELGFKVLFANGLDERTLIRSEPEGRKGFVGITHNEAVNLLFVQRVTEFLPPEKTWVALHRGHAGVGISDVKNIGGRILFGDERGLDGWSARVKRDDVALESWCLQTPEVTSAPPASGPTEELLLPLLRKRRGDVKLFDDRGGLVAGDEVVFAVTRSKLADAREWLERHGWTPSTSATSVENAELAPA